MLNSNDPKRPMPLRWAERFDRWRNDLRASVRSLRRTSTFTISTIAILALSIGAATAMFTVYKVVLVDQLPVAAPDGLVVMHTLDRRGTHLDVPFGYLDVLARDSAIFRGVAGVAHAGAQPFYLTSGGSVLHLSGTAASANFFDVLGTAPLLGHFFHPEDANEGAPAVMVLSYSAWQRRFGGDSAVVGRVLGILDEEKPVRVVGVAPPGLEYPAGIDAWVAWRRDSTSSRGQVDIIGRLAPNVTLTIAKQQLLALTQRINPFLITLRRDEKSPPHAFDIYGVEARSFTETVLGGSRWTLIIITLAVGTLLLIACVNVGSLVLVRLLDRSREVAIRRAVGASYSDLLRLFAIESAIIAVAGGILGLATAYTLLRVFAAVAPTALPRREMITLTGAPLAATAAISLGAFLIFGLAPSASASRLGSFVSLRGDSRAGTLRRSTQLRRWLVAAQIALALVMLAGAALFARSLARLESMPLGYTPEHLSILTFDGPQGAMPTPEKVSEIARALMLRVEGIPGVIAASPIENLPFKGQSLFLMKLAPAEQPASERERSPFIPFEFVGPDYFRTFAIPMRRGRAFAATDTKGSNRVVIINETLARQLWPNDDPIGKRLAQGFDNSQWTVVGVAADTHFRELKNVGPVAYFEWEQVEPFWNGFLAVRSTSPLSQLLPSVRAAARDVNSALQIVDAETMDHLLDAPMAQPRMSTLLLVCFGAAALLLAVVGLYGVMSSVVRQQTRDIGVRIALGATPADVRRLVFGDALRIVAVGVGVGALGAIGAGRMLSDQLFEVSTVDPLALSGAAGVLAVTALVALYAPVRRATMVDPVEALRAE